MEFPGLKEYVDYHLKVKDPTKVKQELVARGFPPEVVDSAIAEYFVDNPPKNLEKKGGWIMISIILVLVTFLVLVLFAGYVYYFIINPSFVESPDNPKPPLPINKTNVTANNTPELIIKPENILYLLSNIGVYKLHNSPNGEPSVINYRVSDFSATYSFSVENNKVVSIDSNQDPDVIISSNQKVILEVYDLDGEELKEKVNIAYNMGYISFNQIKDQQTLALKGYFVLLESFTSQGETSGAPSSTGAPGFVGAKEQPQLIPPKIKVIIWAVIAAFFLVLIVLIIVYIKHHKLEKEQMQNPEE